MINLTEATVVVVGADSRTAVKDLDSACVSGLRLAANAIEGIKDAGVPVGQSQRLITAFNNGFAKLTEGRKELVSAIGHMQVIHRRSDQAETDAGCGLPWGDGLLFFTTGENGQQIGDQAPAEVAQA